jgi:hypothetical protein
MKQIFKSMLLLAATATALAACNKEVDTQEPEKVDGMMNVRFSAVVDETETRATLTTDDEQTFTAAWDINDAMTIEALSVDADYLEEGTATWTGAYFDTDLPTCETRGEWTYSAYYPMKESNPFGNERKQDGSNYNSEYDIMKGAVTYSDANLGLDNDGERMVIPMTRLTSILYFHLTSTLDEPLASATLSVEGAQIAAEVVTVNGTGIFDDPEVPKYDSITMTFEGTAPSAKDFRLWFNILPAQTTGLTLTITTTSGKTATLRNTKGKTYVAGKVNKVVKNGLTWETPTVGAAYTWNLASGDLGASGSPEASVTKGNPSLTWTADYTWGGSGASKYLGWSNEKGVQIGSGSATNKCASLVLTTSEYTDYISRIQVNFSHASSGGSSASVKVGGVSLKCGDDTSVSGETDAQNYVFESATLVKGDVEITFSNSAAKAIYVKSIEINPDTRTPQTLSFPQSAYSAELPDGTFASPALSGAQTTVSYDSSDKTVAEVDNTGLVTLKAVGSTVITATATDDDTYQEGTASYTLTVTAGPQSIASVIAAAPNASVYTQGIVAQVNLKGFIITDGTVNLVVFQNEAPSVVVGQSVKVAGKRDTYYNVAQISDPTITPGATGQTVTRTTLSTITSSNATGFTSSQYVSLTGTLSVSGSYYNVSIAGSSVKGSIYQTNASQPFTGGTITEMDGMVVTVTGYVTGSTDSYLNIAPVDIAMAPNAPSLSISPATTSSNPASWPADNDDAKTFTVSATNGTWAITDASTVSGWANISTSGNVITVTPKVKQATEAHTGSIVITLTPSHEGYEAKTATIFLSQAKYSGDSFTDLLTAGCFSATNTTYADFSNASAGGTNPSAAKYAGNSAKTSSGGIQLRSKSSSGIVVTTSGGKAKSITFTIESGTNTIDVYGKNSAYSSAGDLYDSNTKGTKIGSLSTSGTITVSSDYEYIGIRSNNGAVYITKIEIVWE